MMKISTVVYSVITLLFSCSSYSSTFDTLLVETNIIEGTCDIFAPASINFEPEIANTFMTNNQTAAISPLVVRVSNCKGSSKIKSPSIYVSGNLLAGSEDIFSMINSTANNVGVALREGKYTQNLNGFYVPGEMVSSTNAYTHKGAIGDAMAEGEYAYTVGFVSNGQQPTIGKMTAKLIFEFKYN